MFCRFLRTQSYPGVYERPIPSLLTSQQSASSNLNSWETGSNNSSQYNYGPTYAPATEVITPKRGSRGRVTKGRRSSKRGGGQDGPQVCKFWGTPKGCDWAEKCEFVVVVFSLLIFFFESRRDEFFNSVETKYGFQVLIIRPPFFSYIRFQFT